MTSGEPVIKCADCGFDFGPRLRVEVAINPVRCLRCGATVAADRTDRPDARDGRLPPRTEAGAERP